MDRALANAMKRRDELRAEIAEIEHFLSLYNRFSASGGGEEAPSQAEKSEEQKGAESAPATRADGDGGESETPAVRQRGWPKERLKPYIKAAIATAERPLTRGELLRAMQRENIPVGGTDQSKNMGTILWRLKDDFVNLDGYGYWPRELDYEPAGYRSTSGKLALE